MHLPGFQVITDLDIRTILYCTLRDFLCLFTYKKVDGGSGAQGMPGAQSCPGVIGTHDNFLGDMQGGQSGSIGLSRPYET